MVMNWTDTDKKWAEIYERRSCVSHGVYVKFWRLSRTNSSSKRLFAAALRDCEDFQFNELTHKVFFGVFSDIFSPDDLKGIDTNTVEGMARWLEISADNEDAMRLKLPNLEHILNTIVIPNRHLNRHGLPCALEIEVQKIQRAFGYSNISS